MRFFILILLGFFCLQLQAQNDTTIPAESIEVLYHCNMEKDAKIDLNMWKKYLENHFEPDSLALDSIPPGVYKISAHIMIDRTGKVSVARIAEDPGFGLGQGLKKVIENYPGRWTPGERNGRKIKNFRVQPVTYVVEEEETCITESSPGLML